jgi:hypothetical protein
MPESFAVELVEVVQELRRRLAEHQEKEDVAYLDYLDSMDVVAEVRREEEEMPHVWEEIIDGTAPEWLKVYGSTVRAAARLRQFVLGMRTIGGTSAFDVKQMIEHWPQVEPDVQLAMAWLAGRCAKLHERAKELKSSVEQLEASSAKPHGRSNDDLVEGASTCP